MSTAIKPRSIAGIWTNFARKTSRNRLKTLNGTWKLPSPQSNRVQFKPIRSARSNSQARHQTLKPWLPLHRSSSPRPCKSKILTSDYGPQIAYYMAKNPMEAAEIAMLDKPLDAARALGRLESAFRKRHLSGPHRHQRQ